MQTLRRALVALSLALTAVPLAHAAGQGPSRIVSINPFLPLAGSFQGEFESRLRENLSVAVAGSYLDVDDAEPNFSHLDVKLRLYPNERALQGFGIAAGVGVGHQSNVEYVECVGIDGGSCRFDRRRKTSPTFSVEMQYQWLLGSSRNTAVTVGGGAKRYFVGDEPNGFELFDDYRPTFRLTIGYAFR